MARKDVNEGVPTVPPRVKSLIGMRFGRLVVQFFAGIDKSRKSCWCCQCDCGVVCRVPGARLLGTGRKCNQKSCGCLRADPGIRKAARMKVPKAKRAEICNKMRKAVKHRKPAYSMDAHRAAELMGVSVERIEILAKDGILGSTRRRGALFVSSGDVAALIAEQQRKRDRCPVLNNWRKNQYRQAG